MIDQDTRAVIDRLDAAVATSGLSLRSFAHALGTSPSRLSSYRNGRVAPSAAFLIRAERTADALRQARRDSVPTILDATAAVRRADISGDGDWTYALALEARDRLRDILGHHPSHAATWEIQPPANLAYRWKTLFAAFVSHEFIRAGLPAPPWTEGLRLDTEWILDTPRVSETEIKQQTPDWLAERNIFIAEKDLVTMWTHGVHGPLELDAEAMRALLAELDGRLQARGVAASIYVVGGAAWRSLTDARG